MDPQGGEVIETVLGPIDAADLGVTCMHDHLLNDCSRLQREGAKPAPDLDRVGLENLGYLRWNMLASEDNLRLDDADLAAKELAQVKGYGQHSVVECSSWGMGPKHAGFPDIARASGVNVVSAYGAYIPQTLPDWVAQMSEDELEAHLFEALTVAIPGTDFKAGILGIMGTTAEFPEYERGMLRAASRAAARAGSSVSVRLDPDSRRGVEIIGSMTAQGLPAGRILLTNGDEYMDASYWDDLADTGVVIEMCFGTEASHIHRVDNPSDRERFDFFASYLARRDDTRHVLGLSTWTKAQLSSYGGYGYGYLMARVVPELSSRDIDSQRIDAMLIEEPRRLLDRI